MPHANHNFPSRSRRARSTIGSEITFLNTKDDNHKDEKETLDQDPPKEIIDDSKVKKVQVKKSKTIIDDETKAESNR